MDFKSYRNEINNGNSSVKELVLDFMMDDHGDIDIFYHERIQELYEEFFLDTSGKDHTQLHQTYPSYGMQRSLPN